MSAKQQAGDPLPRRWRRRTRLLVAVSGLSGVGLVGLWLLRQQVADALIVRQLAAAGVQADYTIERISGRHQRLVNVRIGDPHRPDLTAREVDVWLTYGLTGPRIDRIRARGVRLRGQLRNGEMTLGEVDRLLPADDDEPFALPDYRIELADAAAVIDSPWGRFAVGIEGEGNPYRSFSAQTFLFSRSVIVAGCRSDALRGGGRIETGGLGTQFVAPISAATVRCDDAGIAMMSPRLRTTITLSPDFTRLRWIANVGASRAAVPQAATQTLDGRTAGEWDVARQIANGELRLRFDSVQNAYGSAAGGAINGRFAYARSQWRVDGGAAVARAQLRGAAASIPTELARQAEAPVLGPVLAAIGRATDSAISDFRAAFPFEIRRDAGAIRVNIARVAADSASGVQVRLVGDSPVLAWRQGALIAGGQLSVSGGGMPDIRANVVRAADGQYSGIVDARPYAASGAAIAVTALRFAADPRGGGRFTTALGASGPFAGGRIDGLAAPVSGTFGPDGRFSLDGGCRQLRFSALSLGNARLGSETVRLCSLAGQPLLAVDVRGVTGGVQTGPLALDGVLGTSPMRLEAAGGRYAFGRDGALRDVNLTIGTGESSLRLAAQTLSLTGSTGRLSGEFDESRVRLGTIPFNLDQMSGNWGYANGQLVVDGRLDVTDIDRGDGDGDGEPDAPRFEPMVVRDARLTLADGRIDATGRLINRESEVAVADVELTHGLTSGTGHAAFTLVPIRFSEAGLQPFTLSELARGVVSNVDGTVNGNGRIDWNSDRVTSVGSFSTSNASMAAAFGPVQGLTGTIRFNDLIGLSTPPGQRATIASINPGIEVIDGEVLYQLLPNQQVRLESGRWPFAGGLLRLHPALLDFAADRPRQLVFDVEGIDAARFLQRYGFENISATGVFDGVLPTVFDADGGRVEGGSLVVRDGGGSLAYVGELTNRELGYFGNLAFGALRSIRYDSLVIRLNGNIDGEMLTEVSFVGLGQGPGARNNFLTRQIAQLPFAFNIRINAPFRQLLTSARSLYDPTILIDQNLPALLRAEAEADDAARARLAPSPPTSQSLAPGVQQQESGNQP